MLPIQWRLEALTDLTSILDYIAQRNKTAARDLHRAIDRAVSNLPGSPYLYRAGRVPGTRELVVHSNYLVIYRITPAFIEIVAVAHTRQRYPTGA